MKQIFWYKGSCTQDDKLAAAFVTSREIIINASACHLFIWLFVIILLSARCLDNIRSTNGRKQYENLTMVKDMGHGQIKTETLYGLWSWWIISIEVNSTKGILLIYPQFVIFCWLEDVILLSFRAGYRSDFFLKFSYH